VRFEISFLFEGPGANVAGMLSNVAVNQHVRLELGFSSKLLLTSVTNEDAVGRWCKVEFSVLLHKCGALECVVAEITDNRLAWIVGLQMRVQTLASEKSFRTNFAEKRYDLIVVFSDVTFPGFVTYESLLAF